LFLVMAYPDWLTSPAAGIILTLPRGAEGRSVDPNWDVIGMRATRSDSLILDACWLAESAAVFCSDDTRRFRHAYLNWFWGSYTPVYLGVAQAAFDELRKVVQTRQPEGYAQPLAYHPDVRRHVAEMSADLEAARLITYRSAWLSDTEGPTAETTAALSYRRTIISRDHIDHFQPCPGLHRRKWRRQPRYRAGRAPRGGPLGRPDPPAQ
jgi:alkylation response protein AidB-like acyl-CoA dehydrogenase